MIELTDIPSGGLGNALHQRIQQATLEGTPYHDPEGAQNATASWDWPRSYLDFESIAFAVRRWIGTKPWQQVPFQFSVHIETECGALDHREFLSLDGTDPRRACAEALVSALPPSGAIITYFASFERSRVEELAALYPDLYELHRSTGEGNLPVWMRRQMVVRLRIPVRCNTSWQVSNSGLFMTRSLRGRMSQSPVRPVARSWAARRSRLSRRGTCYLAAGRPRTL